MQQSNHNLPSDSADRHCYVCGEVGHLAIQCKQGKKESLHPQNPKPGTKSLKAVKSVEMLIDLLSPDTDSESSDSSVSTVRIEDKSSKPRKVTVTIQGEGVIDSGADITIINGDLFKNIAAAAKLRKKAFKQPDKILYTYDQKPFTLDGRVDLDINFDGHTMCTPLRTNYCFPKVS